MAILNSLVLLWRHQYLYGGVGTSTETLVLPQRLQICTFKEVLQYFCWGFSTSAGTSALPWGLWHFVKNGPLFLFFTSLQVLIHHVILTYHVISCDHFCDPLSLWLYCPSDVHCSLMFHLHQFHLFIGHHCSSGLLFSVTLLFCDTYCSSDFIVLFYYKY